MESLQEMRDTMESLRIRYGSLLREANRTVDRKSAQDRYSFANQILRQIERVESRIRAAS